MRAIFLLLLIPTFLISGCTETERIVQPQIIEVVKKDSPIVVPVKIVAGKTTRQDILDQLGTPDSRYTISYSYEFDKEKNKVCKLELDSLNKEHFNIELGPEEQGYKYEDLSITFEVNQNTGKVGNIVWDVTFN